MGTLSLQLFSVTLGLYNYYINNMKMKSLLILLLSLFLTANVSFAATTYSEFCPYLDQNIVKGDSGEKVRQLQLTLIAEKYASTTLTNASGYFGPATENAVKEFQSKNGVALPSGSLGPVTRTIMKRLWCQGTTNSDNLKLNIVSTTTPIISGSEISLLLTGEGVSSCQLNGGKYANQNLTISTGSILNQTLTDKPTRNTTYRLTCIGNSDAFSEKEYSINIFGANPDQSKILTFVASPKTVTQTGTSTISWTSSNTVSCNLSGGGVNKSVATNGSEIVDPNAASTIYTISCIGQSEGSPVSKSLEVKQSLATINFKANPERIAPLSQSTLTWTTTDVRAQNPKCILEYGKETVNLGPSGNYVVSPRVTTNYKLKCYSLDNTLVTSNVTVNVGGSLNIESFTANPNPIDPTGTTTLSWKVQNTSGCKISGEYFGATDFVAIPATTSSVSTTSSTIITPNATTSTYTLACTGLLNQTSSREVTVQKRIQANITKFEANPATITPKGFSNLSWEAKNTRAQYPQCILKTGNQIIANLAASGVQSVSPNETTNYTLTCYGADNSPVSKNLRMLVGTGNGNGKIVEFKAEKNRVNVGENINLSWKTENMKKCSLAEDKKAAENVSLNGRNSIKTTAKGTIEFTLACLGMDDKEDTRKVSVQVATFEAKPSVKISANATDVTTNSFVKLSWNAKDVKNCQLQQSGKPSQNVGLNGTKTIRFTALGQNVVTLKCQSTVNNSAVSDAVRIKVSSSVNERDR